MSPDAQTEVRSYCIRHRLLRSANYPVEVEDGNSAPHIRGSGYRYETKTGKPVHHPNAYRRAWGKPIYIPSTLRIVVGSEWMRRLEGDLAKVKLMRATGRFSAICFLPLTND